MYSGLTLTRASGFLLGAHQKIDRVARNHLEKIIPDNSVFPTSRKILHFEGKNGPDAIKRKSPSRDEPWHYYSPFSDDESEIIVIIREHYDLLVKQLKAGNHERTAFEAAWLAHAIVDGLTPAHHYPYEEKLREIRGGEANETRTSVRKKLIMPGSTRREKMKNNWKMWGAKGLITTHGMFELGVAAIIAPLGFGEAVPKEAEIKRLEAIGVIEWFRQTAREIAVLEMYDNYYKKGWTPKLAWQVRHKLGPAIVQAVTMTWYSALQESGLLQKPTSK